MNAPIASIREIAIRNEIRAVAHALRYPEPWTQEQADTIARCVRNKLGIKARIEAKKERVA